LLLLQAQYTDFPLSIQLFFALSTDPAPQRYRQSTTAVMSSKPYCYRLTERLSSFDDGYYAKANKYQSMINLSICGFHFSSKIEMPGDDRVACHICDKTSTEWHDVHVANVAYICSKHDETCNYHRPRDFRAEVHGKKDMRVPALYEPEYAALFILGRKLMI
jgi:hypothetical protein